MCKNPVYNTVLLLLILLYCLIYYIDTIFTLSVPLIIVPLFGNVYSFSYPVASFVKLTAIVNMLRSLRTIQL